MKPAKKRDMSTLRRQILAEIVQHPLTILPAGAAALACVWAMAFEPSVPAVITIAAGASLSVIGAIYNLMFNGARIRDRILSKWEKDAAEEENLTKQELRHQLLSTPGTDDVLRLYDRLELVYDEACQALRSVSELQREHFRPVIDQNYENAITLLNRLAYLQGRLTNLLSTMDRNDRTGVMATTLARLREQRAKMMGHLRQIIQAMERAALEIPNLSGYEVEKSERDLNELERSLDIARTAYQRLENEVRPISGITRLPPELAGTTPGKSEKE